MPSCEKCWNDAGGIAHLEGGNKVEIYHKLLEGRDKTPCSPKEQAGEYWDEEKQVDTRLMGN